MKTKIAVGTVSGKAYYLLVNELKKRNVPFISLRPLEPVPIEIKVVLTTQEERELMNHDRVLAFDNKSDPALMVNKALQIIQGNECFERLIIGIDPGKVLGVAVLADGKVIDAYNCYSINETLTRIASMLTDIEKTFASLIVVRIGDGVPSCKERLLHGLDKILPARVILESVNEDGTDSCLNEAKHRRGLRDIVSAIQIAGRTGQRFHRRNAVES